MNLLALSLFYGATSISLVESGCSGFHPRNKNINDLCMKWWNKAFHDYIAKPRDRKSCIDKIVETCPEMITTTSSLKRCYNGVDPPHEMWITTVTATKSDTGKSMTYDEKQKKRVCSDDGAPDCNHWWEIGAYTVFDIKIREVCINQITKHCSDKIEKISDTRSPSDLSSKKGYDEVIVTYKYNGKTTSLQNYVRQKNCCY